MVYKRKRPAPSSSEPAPVDKTHEKGSYPIFTSYIVLINPNKQYNDNLESALVAVGNSLFSRSDFDAKYVKVNFGRTADRSEDWLKNVGNDARIEVGDEMHRLHIHVDLDFQHPRDTSLFMDFKKLREDIIQLLDAPSAYIKVTVAHNDRLQQKQYVG